MMNVYNLSDMDEIVNEMIKHMKEQTGNPALLNIRFVFNEVLYKDVDFHQLNLTRGLSYLPLPDWLARKKAIINPKNEDQECFEWAVIAASRCLAIEDRQIYICRRGGNYKRIINLMLISESNRKHYVAIKSYSRLLRSQNTKLKGKEYFCTNYLQGFNEEKSRNKHVGYCKDNESVRIEMPHKAPIAEYSDGQFQFKVPFIMYADFESILELMGPVGPGLLHNPLLGQGNNPRISATRDINVHVPSGWCVHTTFAYSEVKDPLVLNRGNNCIRKLCDHVIGEACCLYKSFPEKPIKPLTKKQ